MDIVSFSSSSYRRNYRHVCSTSNVFKLTYLGKSCNITRQENSVRWPLRAHHHLKLDVQQLYATECSETVWSCACDALCHECFNTANSTSLSDLICILSRKRRELSCNARHIACLFNLGWRTADVRGNQCIPCLVAHNDHPMHGQVLNEQSTDLESCSPAGSLRTSAPLHTSDAASSDGISSQTIFSRLTSPDLDQTHKEGLGPC